LAIVLFFFLVGGFFLSIVSIGVFLLIGNFFFSWENDRLIIFVKKNRANNKNKSCKFKKQKETLEMNDLLKKDCP